MMKIQVILLPFLFYWGIVSCNPHHKNLNIHIVNDNNNHVNECGDTDDGKSCSLRRDDLRRSPFEEKQESRVNANGLNIRETRLVKTASSGTDWGGLFGSLGSKKESDIQETNEDTNGKEAYGTLSRHGFSSGKRIIDGTTENIQQPTTNMLIPKKHGSPRKIDTDNTNSKRKQIVEVNNRKRLPKLSNDEDIGALDGSIKHDLQSDGSVYRRRDKRSLLTTWGKINPDSSITSDLISVNDRAINELFKPSKATLAETLNGGVAISKILAKANEETKAAKAMYRKRYNNDLFHNDFNDWLIFGTDTLSTNLHEQQSSNKKYNFKEDTVKTPLVSQQERSFGAKDLSFDHTADTPRKTRRKNVSNQSLPQTTRRTSYETNNDYKTIFEDYLGKNTGYSKTPMSKFSSNSFLDNPHYLHNDHTSGSKHKTKLEENSSPVKTEFSSKPLITQKFNLYPFNYDNNYARSNSPYYGQHSSHDQELKSKDAKENKHHNTLTFNNIQDTIKSGTSSAGLSTEVVPEKNEQKETTSKEITLNGKRKYGNTGLFHNLGYKSNNRDLYFAHDLHLHDTNVEYDINRKHRPYRFEYQKPNYNTFDWLGNPDDRNKAATNKQASFEKIKINNETPRITKINRETYGNKNRKQTETKSNLINNNKWDFLNLFTTKNNFDDLNGHTVTDETHRENKIMTFNKENNRDETEREERKITFNTANQQDDKYHNNYLNFDRIEIPRRKMNVYSGAKVRENENGMKSASPALKSASDFDTSVQVDVHSVPRQKYDKYTGAPEISLHARNEVNKPAGTVIHRTGIETKSTSATETQTKEGTKRKGIKDTKNYLRGYNSYGNDNIFNRYNLRDKNNAREHNGLTFDTTSKERTKTHEYDYAVESKDDDDSSLLNFGDIYGRKVKDKNIKTEEDWRKKKGTEIDKDYDGIRTESSNLVEKRIEGKRNDNSEKFTKDIEFKRPHVDEAYNKEEKAENDDTGEDSHKNNMFKTTVGTNAGTIEPDGNLGPIDTSLKRRTTEQTRHNDNDKFDKGNKSKWTSSSIRETENDVKSDTREVKKSRVITARNKAREDVFTDSTNTLSEKNVEINDNIINAKSEEDERPFDTWSFLSNNYGNRNKIRKSNRKNNSKTAEIWDDEKLNDRSTETKTSSKVDVNLSSHTLDSKEKVGRQKTSNTRKHSPYNINGEDRFHKSKENTKLELSNTKKSHATSKVRTNALSINRDRVQHSYEDISDRKTGGMITIRNEKLREGNEKDLTVSQNSDKSYGHNIFDWKKENAAPDKNINIHSALEEKHEDHGMELHEDNEASNDATNESVINKASPTFEKDQDTEWSNARYDNEIQSKGIPKFQGERLSESMPSKEITAASNVKLRESFSENARNEESKDEETLESIKLGETAAETHEHTGNGKSNIEDKVRTFEDKIFSFKVRPRKHFILKNYDEYVDDDEDTFAWMLSPNLAEIGEGKETLETHNVEDTPDIRREGKQLKVNTANGSLKSHGTGIATEFSQTNEFDESEQPVSSEKTIGNVDVDVDVEKYQKKKIRWMKDDHSIKNVDEINENEYGSRMDDVIKDDKLETHDVEDTRDVHVRMNTRKRKGQQLQVNTANDLLKSHGVDVEKEELYQTNELDESEKSISSEKKLANVDVDVEKYRKKKVRWMGGDHSIKNVDQINQNEDDSNVDDVIKNNFQDVNIKDDLLVTHSKDVVSKKKLSRTKDSHQLEKSTDTTANTIANIDVDKKYPRRRIQWGRGDRFKEKISEVDRNEYNSNVDDITKENFPLPQHTYEVHEEVLENDENDQRKRPSEFLGGNKFKQTVSSGEKIRNENSWSNDDVTANRHSGRRNRIKVSHNVRDDNDKIRHRGLNIGHPFNSVANVGEYETADTNHKEGRHLSSDSTEEKLRKMTERKDDTIDHSTAKDMNHISIDPADTKSVSDFSNSNVQNLESSAVSRVSTTAQKDSSEYLLEDYNEHDLITSRRIDKTLVDSSAISRDGRKENIRIAEREDTIDVEDSRSIDTKVDKKQRNRNALRKKEKSAAFTEAKSLENAFTSVDNEIRESGNADNHAMEESAIAKVQTIAGAEADAGIHKSLNRSNGRKTMNLERNVEENRSVQDRSTISTANVNGKSSDSASGKHKAHNLENNSRAEAARASVDTSADEKIHKAFNVKNKRKNVNLYENGEEVYQANKLYVEAEKQRYVENDELNIETASKRFTDVNAHADTSGNISTRKVLNAKDKGSAGETRKNGNSVSIHEALYARNKENTEKIKEDANEINKFNKERVMLTEKTSQRGSIADEVHDLLAAHNEEYYTDVNEDKTGGNTHAASTLARTEAQAISAVGNNAWSVADKNSNEHDTDILEEQTERNGLSKKQSSERLVTVDARAVASTSGSDAVHKTLSTDNKASLVKIGKNKDEVHGLNKKDAIPHLKSSKSRMADNGNENDELSRSLNAYNEEHDDEVSKQEFQMHRINENGETDLVTATDARIITAAHVNEGNRELSGTGSEATLTEEETVINRPHKNLESDVSTNIMPEPIVITRDGKGIRGSLISHRKQNAVTSEKSERLVNAFNNKGVSTFSLNADLQPGFESGLNDGISKTLQNEQDNMSSMDVNENKNIRIKSLENDSSRTLGVANVEASANNVAEVRESVHETNKDYLAMKNNRKSTVGWHQNEDAEIEKLNQRQEFSDITNSKKADRFTENNDDESFQKLKLKTNIRKEKIRRDDLIDAEVNDHLQARKESAKSVKLDLNEDHTLNSLWKGNAWSSADNDAREMTSDSSDTGATDNLLIIDKKKTKDHNSNENYIHETKSNNKQKHNEIERSNDATNELMNDESFPSLFGNFEDFINEMYGKNKGKYKDSFNRHNRLYQNDIKTENEQDHDIEEKESESAAREMEEDKTKGLKGKDKSRERIISNKSGNEGFALNIDSTSEKLTRVNTNSNSPKTANNNFAFIGTMENENSKEYGNPLNKQEDTENENDHSSWNDEKSNGISDKSVFSTERRVVQDKYKKDEDTENTALNAHENYDEENTFMNIGATKKQQIASSTEEETQDVTENKKKTQQHNPNAYSTSEVSRITSFDENKELQSVRAANSKEKLNIFKQEHALSQASAATVSQSVTDYISDDKNHEMSRSNANVMTDGKRKYSNKLKEDHTASNNAEAGANDDSKVKTNIAVETDGMDMKEDDIWSNLLDKENASGAEASTAAVITATGTEGIRETADEKVHAVQNKAMKYRTDNSDEGQRLEASETDTDLNNRIVSLFDVNSNAQSAMIGNVKAKSNIFNQKHTVSEASSEVSQSIANHISNEKNSAVSQATIEATKNRKGSHSEKLKDSHTVSGIAGSQAIGNSNVKTNVAANANSMNIVDDDRWSQNGVEAGGNTDSKVTTDVAAKTDDMNMKEDDMWSDVLDKEEASGAKASTAAETNTIGAEGARVTIDEKLHVNQSKDTDYRTNNSDERHESEVSETHADLNHGIDTLSNADSKQSVETGNVETGSSIFSQKETASEASASAVSQLIANNDSNEENYTTLDEKTKAMKEKGKKYFDKLSDDHNVLGIKNAQALAETQNINVGKGKTRLNLLNDEHASSVEANAAAESITSSDKGAHEIANAKHHAVQSKKNKYRIHNIDERQILEISDTDTDINHETDTLFNADSYAQSADTENMKVGSNIFNDKNVASQASASVASKSIVNPISDEENYRASRGKANAMKDKEAKYLKELNDEDTTSGIANAQATTDSKAVTNSATKADDMNVEENDVRLNSLDKGNAKVNTADETNILDGKGVRETTDKKDHAIRNKVTKYRTDDLDEREVLEISEAHADQNHGIDALSDAGSNVDISKSHDILTHDQDKDDLSPESIDNETVFDYITRTDDKMVLNTVDAKATSISASETSRDRKEYGVPYKPNKKQLDSTVNNTDGSNDTSELEGENESIDAVGNANQEGNLKKQKKGKSMSSNVELIDKNNKSENKNHDENSLYQITLASNADAKSGNALGRDNLGSGTSSSVMSAAEARTKQMSSFDKEKERESSLSAEMTMLKEVADINKSMSGVPDSTMGIIQAESNANANLNDNKNSDISKGQVRGKETHISHSLDESRARDETHNVVKDNNSDVVINSNNHPVTDNESKDKRKNIWNLSDSIIDSNTKEKDNKLINAPNEHVSATASASSNLNSEEKEKLQEETNIDLLKTSMSKDVLGDSKISEVSQLQNTAAARRVAKGKSRARVNENKGSHTLDEQTLERKTAEVVGVLNDDTLASSGTEKGTSGGSSVKASGRDIDTEGKEKVPDGQVATAANSNSKVSNSKPQDAEKHDHASASNIPLNQESAFASAITAAKSKNLQGDDDVVNLTSSSAESNLNLNDREGSHAVNERSSDKKTSSFDRLSNNYVGKKLDIDKVKNVRTKASESNGIISNTVTKDNSKIGLEAFESGIHLTSGKHKDKRLYHSEKLLNSMQSQENEDSVRTREANAENSSLSRSNLKNGEMNESAKPPKYTASKANAFASTSISNNSEELKERNAIRELGTNGNKDENVHTVNNQDKMETSKFKLQKGNNINREIEGYDVKQDDYATANAPSNGATIQNTIENHRSRNSEMTASADFENLEKDRSKELHDSEEQSNALTSSLSKSYVDEKEADKNIKSLMSEGQSSDAAASASTVVDSDVNNSPNYDDASTESLAIASSKMKLGDTLTLHNSRKKHLEHESGSESKTKENTDVKSTMSDFNKELYNDSVVSLENPRNYGDASATAKESAIAKSDKRTDGSMHVLEDEANAITSAVSIAKNDNNDTNNSEMPRRLEDHLSKAHASSIASSLASSNNLKALDSKAHSMATDVAVATTQSRMNTNDNENAQVSKEGNRRENLLKSKSRNNSDSRQKYKADDFLKGTDSDLSADVNDNTSNANAVTNARVVSLNSAESKVLHGSKKNHKEQFNTIDRKREKLNFTKKEIDTDITRHLLEDNSSQANAFASVSSSATSTTSPDMTISSTSHNTDHNLREYDDALSTAFQKEGIQAAHVVTNDQERTNILQLQHSKRKNSNSNLQVSDNSEYKHNENNFETDKGSANTASSRNDVNVSAFGTDVDSDGIVSTNSKKSATRKSKEGQASGHESRAIASATSNSESNEREAHKYPIPYALKGRLSKANASKNAATGSITTESHEYSGDTLDTAKATEKSNASDVRKGDTRVHKKQDHRRQMAKFMSKGGVRHRYKIHDSMKNKDLSDDTFFLKANENKNRQTLETRSKVPITGSAKSKSKDAGLDTNLDTLKNHPSKSSAFASTSTHAHSANSRGYNEASNNNRDRISYGGGHEEKLLKTKSRSNDIKREHGFDKNHSYAKSLNNGFIDNRRARAKAFAAAKSMANTKFNEIDSDESGSSEEEFNAILWSKFNKKGGSSRTDNRRLSPLQERINTLRMAPSKFNKNTKYDKNDFISPGLLHKYKEFNSKSDKGMNDKYTYGANEINKNTYFGATSNNDAMADRRMKNDGRKSFMGSESANLAKFKEKKSKTVYAPKEQSNSITSAVSKSNSEKQEKFKDMTLHTPYNQIDRASASASSSAMASSAESFPVKENLKIKSQYGPRRDNYRDIIETSNDTPDKSETLSAGDTNAAMSKASERAGKNKNSSIYIPRKQSSVSDASLSKSSFKRNGKDRNVSPGVRNFHTTLPSAPESGTLNINGNIPRVASNTVATGTVISDTDTRANDHKQASTIHIKNKDADSAAVNDDGKTARVTFIGDNSGSESQRKKPKTASEIERADNTASTETASFNAAISASSPNPQKDNGYAITQRGIHVSDVPGKNAYTSGLRSVPDNSNIHNNDNLAITSASGASKSSPQLYDNIYDTLSTKKPAVSNRHITRHGKLEKSKNNADHLGKTKLAESSNDEKDHTTNNRLISDFTNYKDATSFIPAHPRITVNEYNYAFDFDNTRFGSDDYRLKDKLEREKSPLTESSSILPLIKSSRDDSNDATKQSASYIKEMPDIEYLKNDQNILWMSGKPIGKATEENLFGTPESMKSLKPQADNEYDKGDIRKTPAVTADVQRTGGISDINRDVYPKSTLSISSKLAPKDTESTEIADIYGVSPGARKLSTTNERSSSVDFAGSPCKTMCSKIINEIKTDIYIVKRIPKQPVRITHMKDSIPPIVTYRLIPQKVYDEIHRIIARSQIAYSPMPLLS